jgi:hypothetical protein
MMNWYARETNHCALHLSSDLSSTVLTQKLGEAKVGDLGVQPLVEENVA